MKRTWKLLPLLILAANTGRAQDLKDCWLVPDSLGEASFLAFDHDLKAALSSQDVDALTALVRFPLRVNFTGGATISLENTAALRLRFQNVFPSSLRDAVAKQKPQDAACLEAGIMYGAGSLWIDVVGEGKAARYAVYVVNVPEDSKKGSSRESRPVPRSRVEFACNAERHRVLIDTIEDGSLRYRAWNKPRALDERPDMIVRAGARDIEGTSSCSHKIWRFERGKTEFRVSELGCTVENPPNGARGVIEVLVGGEKRMESWCY